MIRTRRADRYIVLALLAAAGAIVGACGDLGGPTGVAGIRIVGHAQRLELDPTQAVLLKAEVYDGRGRSLDVPVEWRTSNAAVATVSGVGEVAAQNAGTARVGAYAEGGLIAELDVEVRVEPKVLSVHILGERLQSVELGSTTTLTASAAAAIGTVPAALEWHTDDPEALRVEDGRVTALLKGSARVIATAPSGAADTVWITVPRAGPPPLRIRALDAELWPAPLQAALSAALRRWENIFTGALTPATSDDGPCDLLDITGGRFIDVDSGIVIVIRANTTPDPQLSAASGHIVCRRPGTGTALIGVVGVALYHHRVLNASNEYLEWLVTHEIGHALGLITLPEQTVLETWGRVWAVEGFRQEFGFAPQLGVLNVRGYHWADPPVGAADVMGVASSPDALLPDHWARFAVERPRLTRVSLGALKDLGYPVSLRLAEPPVGR